MEKTALLLNESFETMPWDAVDTVVFDIGNVLLRFDPPYILRTLFDDAQKRNVMMEKVFRSPYWIELDRGTLTYAQAARAMAQGDAQLEKDAAYLLKHWCSHKQVIEPGWAAARACAAHGKRLCLLSNYHREAFEYNLAHHEIFSLFDVRLISCYVHQLKPDAEIYDTLIHVSGLDPSRSVFLDDMPGNVQAAIRAGLHGFWVRSEQEMGAFFTGANA